MEHVERLRLYQRLTIDKEARRALKPEEDCGLSIDFYGGGVSARIQTLAELFGF